MYRRAIYPACHSYYYYLSNRLIIRKFISISDLTKTVQISRHTNRENYIRMRNDRRGWLKLKYIAPLEEISRIILLKERDKNTSTRDTEVIRRRPKHKVQNLKPKPTSRAGAVT